MGKRTKYGKERMERYMDLSLDTPVYYIEGSAGGAGTKIGALLFELFDNTENTFDEVVFLCIGSDRITGDSLGPLIGHRLEKEKLSRCCVYGTLSEPVHALNLHETVDTMKKEHPNSLTVAIDASLGSKKHQGFVTVGKGSLEPGLGVKKKLPPVGDISITGIVNLSGAFEHFLLQTTRLSTVVGLADAIVTGILLAHHQYFGTRRPSLFTFFHPEEERRRSLAKFTALPAASAASRPKGSW